MTELGDRADAIRKREVMPEEDNMLKVCMDGRKAALDLRLLGRPMTVPGKIETAAERVSALWLAHRDDTYPGPDGQDAPVRGSLQLVFCDIGTPGDDWNGYDELRDQLTARGLPRDAIRFVHDAKTDRDKASCSPLPRRNGCCPDRQHREDGRWHQRPVPRHRPAPPGLPLAAR